jgi:hypothetical protein
MIQCFPLTGGYTYDQGLTGFWFKTEVDVDESSALSQLLVELSSYARL